MPHLLGHSQGGRLEFLDIGVTGTMLARGLHRGCANILMASEDAAHDGGWDRMLCD
jgi:hypothetical protein